MSTDGFGITPLTLEELFVRLREIKAVVFDFDGVFTDNTVMVDQTGVESVRCWRSDGLGLSRIKKLGLKTLIISTEANPVVSVRAEKLKVDCLQGVENKAEAIVKWVGEANIALSDVVFVGNDINDIPAFKKVGVPICVADAYDEVLPFTRYKTRAAGGYGAVREVCDLVAAAYSERN